MTPKIRKEINFSCLSSDTDVEEGVGREVLSALIERIAGKTRADVPPA